MATRKTGIIKDCIHCGQYDAGEVFPCKDERGHSWKDSGYRDPTVQPAKGTPKTIDEAIRNGVLEFNVKGEPSPSFHIRRHVKDFMSQKFSAESLSGNPEAMRIWYLIFPEDENGG